MNIETIKSKINKSNGLMRPNLFLTTVTNPRCMITDQRSTDLLCSSATLPGKMITVQPHRRFGYGTEDRRVTGAIMPDLSLTFFVGGDGEPLAFFNEWLENIFFTNVSKGSDGKHRGMPVFNVGFRDNYITTIETVLYDPTGKQFLKYTMYEAFPMQIGDVTVGWSENDSFSSVAINFHYRYYVLDKIPEPVVNTNTSGSSTRILNGKAFTSLHNSQGRSDIVNALQRASNQFADFGVVGSDHYGYNLGT